MLRVVDHLGGRDKILDTLNSNLNWIKKSFYVNNCKGSSATSNLWGQWSDPYPETTGYLLITLLKAYDYTNNIEFLSLAKKQVHFFSSIQNADGSFFQKPNIKQPIIFDTAQIILGLCKLYEHLLDIAVLDMIRKSVSWLDSTLNDQGLFLNFNYKQNYNPSYYTRVFWPMMEAYNLLNEDYSNKVIAGIDRILNCQNSNLSFPDNSFDGQSMALTHTMAYTIRGLMESGILLDRIDITSAVELYMDKTQLMVNGDKQLYGAYDEQWNANKSFVCVAGNLQFAIIGLKLNPSKYEHIITSLLTPIIKSQRSYGTNKGAVPSSLPIWGKYQRFKYTNWTQKFFSDTLLCLLNE